MTLSLPANLRSSSSSFVGCVSKLLVSSQLDSKISIADCPFRYRDWAVDRMQ
ncbi:hypothetical protein BY996DRAFT_6551904 [Phakopsora pachyrhizi]|nr:hypothetical protein BY996DRAFT_6551904 [Phakopsora pachyrhizi]